MKPDQIRSDKIRFDFVLRPRHLEAWPADTWPDDGRAAERLVIAAAAAAAEHFFLLLLLPRSSHPGPAATPTPPDPKHAEVRPVAATAASHTMSDMHKAPVHEPEDSNGGFVTDEEHVQRQPSRSQGMPARTTGAPEALIKVEPLRRDQMQPSYAQDLGVGDIVSCALCRRDLQTAD